MGKILQTLLNVMKNTEYNRQHWDNFETYRVLFYTTAEGRENLIID